MRVVAYDITAASRLRRVAKLCELYGIRVEKSVFETHLDDERFRQFWNELAALIDKEHDAVVAYPVCKACEERIDVMGVEHRPPKLVCYFL